MAQCVAMQEAGGASDFVNELPHELCFDTNGVSRIKGKLFNELKSSDPALYDRLYSSSSLKFVEFFYCKEHWVGPVHHDFLVLHLLNGNDNATHHYIRAEKRYDGIHIKWYSKPLQEHRKETIDCKHSNIHLRATEVILENFELNYHLLYSNCKHYARAVAKNLIQALPISEALKQKYKQKIDEISYFAPDETNAPSSTSSSVCPA